MTRTPRQSSSLLTRMRRLSSRQIRQRGSLRSTSALTGSAALVIVLIRKWLQPSGFTQNVQRTQRIVSGKGVILQPLGAITSHSPHDNALDRRASTVGQYAWGYWPQCVRSRRIEFPKEFYPQPSITILN